MARERDVNFDFIRVYSMIFTICVHTAAWPLQTHPEFKAILSNVFLTCNANFFMLSGALNLSKQYSDANGTTRALRIYYKRKGINILFPFVVGTALACLWEVLAAGNPSLPAYLQRTYGALLGSDYPPHLWFMFDLIGMLAGAPFLARAFQHMSDDELRALLIAGLCWNTVKNYFAVNLGLNFAYTGWFLSEWMLYFFMGYYAERVLRRKNCRALYILGAAGFVINYIGKLFFPESYANAYDSAPAFALFALAAFVFVRKHVAIRGVRFKRLIGFVARHAFFVYVFHWYVLARMHEANLFWMGNCTVFFCMTVPCALLISLALATVVDALFVEPVKRALLRRFVRES